MKNRRQWNPVEMVAEAEQRSRRDCTEAQGTWGSRKGGHGCSRLRSFGDFDENPLVGLVSVRSKMPWMRAEPEG